eukprot:TRINITY_DN10526_c0_g1_i1.p1 TRINITY_DN10526_c0_g1~~TRINITY_DN10526_c0_g1_i1.p1  ORF type:complete len:516 (-),score=81.10 TRINITY_DN10526_c0_g1_i1:20-1540(-)
MHAPKPLSTLPLAYDTHLGNNAQAVVRQHEALHQGYVRYVALLSGVCDVFANNAKQFRQLLSAAGDFVEADFGACPTVKRACQSACGVLERHAQVFETYADDWAAALKATQPTDALLADYGQKLKKDYTILESRRQRLVSAVTKGRTRYEEAEAWLQLSGRTRQPVTQTMITELKTRTTEYLNSTERFAEFYPEFNESMSQVLRGFEQTNRCVLTAVQQSLHSWAKQITHLSESLLAETCDLFEPVRQVNVEADVCGFIERNHLPPDEDPLRLYKFHVYHPTAEAPMSPGAPPKRAVPPPSLKPQLTISRNESNGAEASDPLEEQFDAFLGDTTGDAADLWDAVRRNPGRLALARSLRRRSLQGLSAEPLSEPAVTDLCSAALDSASKEHDYYSASMLVHVLHKSSGLPKALAEHPLLLELPFWQDFCLVFIVLGNHIAGVKSVAEWETALRSAARASHEGMEAEVVHAKVESFAAVMREMGADSRLHGGFVEAMDALLHFMQRTI